MQNVHHEEVSQKKSQF